MAAVPALTDGRAALAALKRALPRRAGAVVACRTLDQVRSVLARRLAEAVVVSPRMVPLPALVQLARDFPTVPLVCYTAFRPDDGELLLAVARTLRAPVA